MLSDFDLSFETDRAEARRRVNTSRTAAWKRRLLDEARPKKEIQLTFLGSATFFLCFRRYLMQDQN